MILLSLSHKEDCEISRTQGNSSCHQAALAKAEKTQGVRKALSIIKALFRTSKRKNASTLVKLIGVATTYSPLPSRKPCWACFSQCPFLGPPAQPHCSFCHAACSALILQGLLLQHCGTGIPKPENNKAKTML